MPSTRKQKAKERRSRQSDIMSDIENLDVMLGSYQSDYCETQNENDGVGIDSRSNRHEENSNQNENDYRPYLNTNLRENSCLTVETSKAISSEISLEMSRKVKEMQTSLNSQIIDVINFAIETRVLPSIENAVGRQNSAQNKNLDLRSDGLHQDSPARENPQKDLRSNRPHPENVSKSTQDAQKEFPRLISVKSSQTNHYGENSEDSQQSDEAFGYDMVTGANHTPQLVPEFLTGQLMQSRNKTLLYFAIGIRV